MLRTLNVEAIKVDGPKMGDYGEYYRVGVKTNIDGENTWMSGFLKYAPKWEVGDEIQVMLSQNIKDGNKYWNFKLPTKVVTEAVQGATGGIEGRVQVLESEVKTLKAMVKGLVVGKGVTYEPTDMGANTTMTKKPELTVDDIPF